MADNLSISIGIDTAKLRADAAIVKEELRKVNQQVTAAAKAGDVAGVKATTAEQDRLARQLAATNQKIRENTAATREATQANRGYTASLRETGLEFGHLAHAAGLPIEGLKALRAGFLAFAAVEVIRGFTAAVKQINDLNIAAKEAGTTVGTIKGLQSAFRAAGDDANKAAPLLSNFNKVLREARMKETAAYWGTSGTGPAFDAADPLKSLNINAANYKNTLEGQKKAASDTARALLQMKQEGRIDEANVLSLKLYGHELDAIEEEVQKIADGTLKIEEPTKAMTQTQKEYNQMVANGVEAWDRMTEAIGRAGMAAVVATSKLNIPQPPGGGGAAATGGGFASGGYIRGAGSGTSDSILARLSNGEFVVNAASTRRLGTSFLNGLNSFAAGGLVNVPPIRFAEGGLVPGFAGGGQAMAAFHFESGNSFRLGGPVDVVNAMVTEAHAQQVRSAGIKPSWYAARPSGR